MIKTGDSVRFLNSVGGGIVKRIDEKQNLVFVEDEDGFEVPVLAREVVVVGPVNETTNFPKKDFKSKPAEAASQQSRPDIPAEQPKIEVPIVETAGGDTLKTLLAFFPNDIKKLQESSYECYLVNDSNYFLFYNVVVGAEGNRKSIANGVIEPNMQEFLCEIAKSQLNDWEKVRVQIVPFKKDKTYTEQKVMDFTLKMNTVKFYKLHSFTETDYFDDLCMLVSLTEESQKKQLAEVSPSEIRQALQQKSQPEHRPRIIHKQQRENETIEVDLHINALLDTTAGLSNADMLGYQMETFHRILEENKNRKGQKIVFIHGKDKKVTSE